MDPDTLAKIGEYTQLAFTIIGAAATVAAATPTPRDDNLIRKVIKVIDVIGANWGNAKNEER